MEIQSTRLLVVGGGTGGYAAAIRAAQNGVQTTLVEGSQLGGTCLNIGCIPSKALIHVADEFELARRFAGEGAFGIHTAEPRLDIAEAVKWKDGVVQRLTTGVAGLLKKAGARVVEGWATILDGKTVEVTRGTEVLRIACEHLLIAPGSVPLELPSLPFGGRVISSTEAVSPDEIPRRLAVVGAGYIGLELGIAYRKMGSEVTVLEALDRVMPLYDAELTRPLEASLRRLGIALRLGCRVLGASDSGDAVRVQDESGAESELAADRVLVAIGRKPRTEGWGLERLRLDMQGRFVRIDDQCRTSMRNVWAVGDVTGEPMLAHRATAQGEMVAEIIAGHRRRFDPVAIPAVCFTDPEIVAVGRGPGDPAEFVSAQFPLAGNGRALTLDAREGFVRVVARREDHLIVGWHAVGRGVSELSAAFAQSIEMGARLEDVAGTIHPHPTLGEAVQEAAMRALGRPLHI